MRVVLTIVLGLVAAAVVQAQDKKAEPGKRFGIEADLKTYPQDSPEEVLDSVVKAIKDKRIDYLLTHLADPKFVDARVEAYGGKFEDLVKETQTKLLDDPGALKRLEQFLKQGEWKVRGTTVIVRLKDVNDRCVYLSKKEGRWYLENRWKPPVEAKDK